MCTQNCHAGQSLRSRRITREAQSRICLFAWRWDVTAIAAAAIACACLLVTAPASAQEPVEPDRPDVTNGTHIVGVGLLQVEMGGLYTRPANGKHGFESPLTFRVGLADSIEVRIGTDGFVTQSDGVTRQVGIGNTSVGAKLRLWADPGGVPLVSIMPTINLPTADAAKGFGSGDRDYLLAVLSGADIGRHWHADVNYGIGRVGAGHGAPHFTQHLTSLSVSVAATDNLNPYGEAFWFSKQDVEGGAVVAVDAGAIYELGPRYAVDGGLQVTLTGSRDVALFGGVSLIVGEILGAHGKAARERQVQRRRARRTRGR